MNDIIEAEAGSEAERNTLLIAYILYALGPFTALTAVAGVILNHIKVNDTQSRFIKSHHRWLLRTFWFGLLWSILAGLLMVIGVGFLIYVGVLIWYIYRIVRGLLAFTERNALPMG
tara:strand:- start:478 stop:825 length:348 start_codon:yes stop_codon:yes gene_type:complete